MLTNQPKCLELIYLERVFSVTQGLNPFLAHVFSVHAYKKELATVFRDEWKADGVKGIRINVLFHFRHNAAPSSCFFL